MRFDVISLFPDMFTALTCGGVCGRAHARGLWGLKIWNPREFADDVHRTVDDRPYGGGPGMVMMAEPLARTVDAVRQDRLQACADPIGTPPPVILFSPAGAVHGQRTAQQWAQIPGAILVCGRYEGVDQRFIDTYVDHEVSVGDYVLSGGELAAMVWLDSIVRLVPGVLHEAASAEQDSFTAQSGGMLDCPHYTRPELWRGIGVPQVLVSGHHERIQVWRQAQALALTEDRRPDLLDSDGAGTVGAAPTRPATSL